MKKTVLVVLGAVFAGLLIAINVLSWKIQSQNDEIAKLEADKEGQDISIVAFSENLTTLTKEKNSLKLKVTSLQDEIDAQKVKIDDLKAMYSEIYEDNETHKNMYDKVVNYTALTEVSDVVRNFFKCINNREYYEAYLYIKDGKLDGKNEIKFSKLEEMFGAGVETYELVNANVVRNNPHMCDQIWVKADIKVSFNPLETNKTEFSEEYNERYFCIDYDIISGKWLIIEYTDVLAICEE